MNFSSFSSRGPLILLDWGCLCSADMVVGLWGHSRWALGCRVGFGDGRSTYAGGVCVRGDWFPPVKSVADSFWCSPIICRIFDWWGLVSVCVCDFSVGGVAVLWLAWALWGGLGCLLGSLWLVLCGRLLPSMLTGTDG